MAATPSVALLQAPAPSGVRGWLLFLCVVLTIGTPLVVLLYSNTSFVTGYALRGVLALGYGGFAFYCGRLLWKKNPKGVAYTQYLLYFHLGRVSIMAGTHAAMKGYGGLMVLVQVGVAVAWLLYLSKSKRVKNTYDLV